MTVCFLATSVCATAGFTLTRENEAVKQTRQSKLAPPESDETKAQMERAADALGKRKRSQWSAFVLPIEALGSDGTAFADGKIINGHLEELQFEAAKWDELYLILKQQAEQNQSFRAGRMWARFEGLHTNSERRAQFLQTAQERVNRNLEGIASELSRMGLEIPKHLQLEIRAGFYRFSSIHAENEPAKITLDLELLLRPDFPEPVFRFFLMHEILHAIVAKKYPGWSQGSAETFILLAGITSLWQNDQLHSVCEFLESLKRRTEYGREASDYMSSDGHLLAALKNLIRIKAEMDQVGKAIEASAAPAEKLQKSMAGLQRRAFFNARRGIQEWIVKDPTLQEELAFLDMFFSKLEPPKDGGLNLDAAGISDLAAAVDHADAEASLTIAQEVLGTKLFDELLGPDAELRKQAAVSLPLLFEAQNGLHVHRLARVIHQIHCKQKGREGPFRVLDGRTLDEKQQRLFKQLHPKGEFLEEMRGGTLFIRRIDTLKPHDLHFLGELVNNPSVDVRFIFSFSKDSDGGAQTAIPEAVLHKLTYGRNSHTIPSLIERGPQEREDLLKLTLADCAAREGRGKMEFSPDALKFLLSSEWQWPGNLFEMENVVRRAVVLAKGRRVEVRDIQIGGEKYFYEPALVDRVAQSKIPVLAIANPADDAYEVLENIIHRSGRSRHASVWIDAELFTEKNVTDILYGKPESMISGELEQARGGSIVIQNVEKLPPRAQRHLLKVLRQGGFSKYPDGPIGPLDARWYFTTSADLKDLVRRGKFIPDLYYLINGFQLDIPPLRQRREIIPKLAQDIVARAAQRLKVPEPVISPEALVLLKWYPWPGGIDQMHAVLQGAVQMAKAGPIRAEHLHPSFKLEVLLGSEYVTDWKVCKQIVQEYYPGTNFALMEMLMPERALAKVMLTDAEALQKFSQGLRKLLRQARPKFKDAPSFDKALYSPNSLQWFAKNFSQDFLQSLWDSGNLLTFLSYFFQGSTSKDAWEQAVNFIVAKNPTLQGYLAPFIKGSEDLRLRQRLLFRTYRVLFHLHLWGWPVDAPNFLDLLGGLESEAAWEKMFLDLVNKNASQPLKSAMKPLKKRLRLPPKDLELQESTMRDIQDIAVRSPNLPEEEQIGATMQYGTVLKARKLRGGIGAWEERYFPLPTALSETKEFTGRAEVEAQIRSWLNERKLDPATLRVSANTRIRYQHNYKLYERVGGFFSRVVAPCPSDLWRWREEDPVEMDDRKWVASIVHDITGRKQAVETIPEIIAGYVLGYFEAGAYRIKDAKAGGSLDLSAEQKVHVSRSKDTLAWLLEQRDPNFLQQKGAFAFLAPMVKTKKKVKRYIPPFMEPAIPPALLESLRTDEKEFLNLVMHAASEESVRERPAPVAATLEKSLSLAEENKRGREVAAMASAVERSIDNILDHSPFPMPGEQMERLIEEVFHRQTEESGNFVGWFVGKFGVRLDLKRKSEETSMLEREMIRVFKDSWNLFGNDRKKLKDLTVLFARLHGFLLRQDEADLELPFGNRHDALHVLQLLRLTEDIMTKNPLLGPNALGSHYGQHGALLAKLAVLCHDLGYAEFVQLQRKAMREAEAAIREGRDPPPMPHKSMHSALSVHIINTHLEDLLRNLFDLNAEKPGYPGRDLFADFREAVLYHSTSKKKLSNVEYNEVRNPLLFLTTLADKLDYQFHRIKEDSRFYEIFTDVLKYRDSVYRGFPNASLREQICKEVKGMSPSDYHDFLHSFGALSVCRVEVGLVLAGKPVSHAFYQMLSPKEKGNVRLVVTTVLDRHIVDLASGFGDEIGNPAYFQVERAKGSMDMFRCNGKAIEMRTKLVPLRPADEALPVWDMERRDRVLKELREEFGEEQIIDPEEFEAFVHASTQPKAIKNALLAVQALVGGPLSTRSGTPEIVKVPQAMYPLVVAIAKGIHFEEFNQKLAARLRTLAPPLPDSVDSLRYVAEHPPGLQTWLEWSKSFADDLLADAARFKRDSIRWRSSYQWHNQLKLFNQYLLPRLSELSQAEGTLRVAHLQPGYPPATMLDLANLLVEHDLDATVTGLEIVRPAFEISLANGDKVLTNMDGAVLAFDLRNTKDQRLYHSLKDRLHKFVVELPEGMQSKKEMMHPNDWEAMRREVGDIETRLKRIRTKLDKVPTQVEDGTEPEMVSLEDANHVLTSLLDQSDALVQSLKKEHLLQDADLPTQLTRRFRQEKRIESIHPELEKEIKSFVEAFQQSGSLSYESPKRWQISRISGEQGDFYKNWLATQTEKVRKRMSFDSTMTPEEGFDVVYAFNIPHVDLRTAGKKVKPRGEFFLGYGWDERRKERGNDIAFMRFEKEAEWLKSKELSFALCKDEEHYASISMQRLRELLMHCGENALLTELEAAYPGKAEKIDQDEQLPEVFRKVYLLLLQNGFNPTVNERLLLFNIHKDPRSGSWKSTPTKQTVDAILALVQDTQNDDTFEQAWKILTDIYARTNDKQLQSDVLDAVNTMQMLSYAHRVVFCKTTHQEKIRQWVRENVLVQEKTVSDAQLKRKMWVAAELSRAEKIVLNRHLFFFVYRDLSDPDALEQLLLLLNPPLQPSDLPSQGVFEFTLDIVTRLSERPGLIEKFSSDKKKMLELIRVLENIMRHSTDPYPRLLLANALVRIASQLGEPERIDTIADFLLEQMDKTMDMVQALDLVRQISYVCGLEGRKEKMVQLFEKIKDRGPQFITVFTQEMKKITNQYPYRLADQRWLVDLANMAWQGKQKELKNIVRKLISTNNPNPKDLSEFYGSFVRHYIMTSLQREGTRSRAPLTRKRLKRLLGIKGEWIDKGIEYLVDHGLVSLESGKGYILRAHEPETKGPRCLPAAMFMGGGIGWLGLLAAGVTAILIGGLYKDKLQARPPPWLPSWLLNLLPDLSHHRPRVERLANSALAWIGSSRAPVAPTLNTINEETLRYLRSDFILFIRAILQCESPEMPPDFSKDPEFNKWLLLFWSHREKPYDFLLLLAEFIRDYLEPRLLTEVAGHLRIPVNLATMMHPGKFKGNVPLADTLGEIDFRKMELFREAYRNVFEEGVPREKQEISRKLTGIALAQDPLAALKSMMEQKRRSLGPVLLAIARAAYGENRHAHDILGEDLADILKRLESLEPDELRLRAQQAHRGALGLPLIVSLMRPRTIPENIRQIVERDIALALKRRDESDLQAIARAQFPLPFWIADILSESGIAQNDLLLERVHALATAELDERVNRELPYPGQDARGLETALRLLMYVRAQLKKSPSPTIRQAKEVREMLEKSWATMQFSDAQKDWMVKMMVRADRQRRLGPAPRVGQAEVQNFAEQYLKPYVRTHPSGPLGAGSREKMYLWAWENAQDGLLEGLIQWFSATESQEALAHPETAANAARYARKYLQDKFFAAHNCYCYGGHVPGRGEAWPWDLMVGKVLDQETRQFQDRNVDVKVVGSLLHDADVYRGSVRPKIVMPSGDPRVVAFLSGETNAQTVATAKARAVRSFVNMRLGLKLDALEKEVSESLAAIAMAPDSNEEFLNRIPNVPPRDSEPSVDMQAGHEIFRLFWQAAFPDAQIDLTRASKAQWQRMKEFIALEPGYKIREMAENAHQNYKKLRGQSLYVAGYEKTAIEAPQAEEIPKAIATKIAAVTDLIHALSEQDFQAYLAMRRTAVPVKDAITQEEWERGVRVHAQIQGLLEDLAGAGKARVHSHLERILLEEDKSRMRQLPGPRGNMDRDKILRITHDSGKFQDLHGTYPAREAVAQADPFKKDLDDQAREAMEIAKRMFEEKDLLAGLGIRGPPDLATKWIKFVHHEELLTVPSHAEGWVDGIFRDTICITHEIWRSLSKEQRAILLVHEIVESEYLKRNYNEEQAHEAAGKAEGLIDSERHLDRRVIEILKDYRIYNGVDEIHLFITHPHGDHSSYIWNYVKGKMENLIGRIVPPLKEKLELYLGNRFTHEVTSYLLRPSKRIITIFDMGGYKGAGEEPFIEQINAHYRIGDKKMQKPITLYADLYTAKTLDFQNRVGRLKASLRKQGLDVNIKLEIFDHKRRTIAIEDSDHNKITVTAHPAFHLARYVGSSIFTLKKWAKDGLKVLSSFSLVSEIGDTFPYRMDQAALDDIANSDIIAPDGTNATSPPAESPRPVRMQDNKIHAFTERLNRSWATISHINTTGLGSIAEALEASRTLDKGIPIVVFAGKDAIDQLKMAYQWTDDGKPLVQEKDGLITMDSTLVQKDSKGATIYLVSDMEQFNEALRSRPTKDIALKDVLPDRLKRFYASGRNMDEIAEYLSDWAKSPGMNAADFDWLYQELQKGEQGVLNFLDQQDIVASCKHRVLQTLRDFFDKNPDLGRWELLHLENALNSLVDARRSAWAALPKDQLLQTTAAELSQFVAQAKPSLKERETRRPMLLAMIKKLKGSGSLQVPTQGRSRAEIVADTVAAIKTLLADDNPFTQEVLGVLQDRLQERSKDWASYQAVHIPFLILEEAQRYLQILAGQQLWKPSETRQLNEQVASAMLAHGRAGVSLSAGRLRGILFDLLEEGAVPADIDQRSRVLEFLSAQNLEDPRVMNALIKLLARDNKEFNQRINAVLLKRADGSSNERLGDKLEDLAAKGQLSGQDAKKLLRTFSNHPWPKPERQRQWFYQLLIRYKKALRAGEKWLGLDNEALLEQVVESIGNSETESWSPAERSVFIQELLHSSRIPKEQRMRLVFTFLTRIEDRDLRKSVLESFSKKQLKEYNKIRDLASVRKQLPGIESALWELAKMGSGQVLTIGSGHFSSENHKAVHLLNQIFPKRYAEILVEGRPRLEGWQGKISRALLADEKMALFGPEREILARCEHQWISGHITFEEEVKLLELIYNRRMAGICQIPERGLLSMTREEILKLIPLDVRIVITTSSKYVQEKEGKLNENIPFERRRFIEEWLGHVFPGLEAGAGLQSVRVGDLLSKQYTRYLPGNHAYLGELYEMAARGEIRPDLGNLPSSKTPAEIAQDIANVERGWSDAQKKGFAPAAYEKIQDLDRELQSQILRLGLRVVLDYGSKPVITQQEMGDMPAEKAFAKPAAERGLHWQMVDAMEKVARDAAGKEVVDYFQEHMDSKHIQKAPELFDQDGNLTTYLKARVERYANAGFVKAAVMIDPLKRWAQSHGMQLRVELPDDPPGRDRLMAYLADQPLEKIQQMANAKAQEFQAKKLHEASGLAEDFLVFEVERAGDVLTLRLNVKRKTAAPAERGSRFNLVTDTFRHKVIEGMRARGLDDIVIEEVLMLLERLKYLGRADLNQKVILGHEQIPAIIKKIALLAGLPELEVEALAESILYHDYLHVLLRALKFAEEETVADLVRRFLSAMEAAGIDVDEYVQFFAMEYGYVGYHRVGDKRIIDKEMYDKFLLAGGATELTEDMLLDCLVYPWRSPYLHAHERFQKMMPIAETMLRTVKISRTWWRLNKEKLEKYGKEPPTSLWHLLHVQTLKEKSAVQPLRRQRRYVGALLKDLKNRRRMRKERDEQIKFSDKIIDGLTAITQMPERTVKSADGATIHYRVGGSTDPNAKTLFFVHGWTGNLYHWVMQVPAFTKKYRIILMDLPGHGNTPMRGSAEDLLTEQCPRDILAILEKEGITKGVVSIGHSMGAMGIQELFQKIYQHPGNAQTIGASGFWSTKTFSDYKDVFDSAVFISSTPSPPLETSFYKKTVRGALGDAFVSFMHKWLPWFKTPERHLRWLREHPHETGVLEKQVNEHILTGDNPTVFDYLLPISMQAAKKSDGERHQGLPYQKVVHSWKGMKNHDTGGLMPDIPMPVLIVHGGRDEFCKYEDVSYYFQEIPRVRFKLLPHQRHMPHFEAPDLVNPAILEFLEKGIPKKPLRQGTKAGSVLKEAGIHGLRAFGVLNPVDSSP